MEQCRARRVARGERAHRLAPSFVAPSDDEAVQRPALHAITFHRTLSVLKALRNALSTRALQNNQPDERQLQQAAGRMLWRAAAAAAAVAAAATVLCALCLPLLLAAPFAYIAGELVFALLYAQKYQMLSGWFGWLGLLMKPSELAWTVNFVRCPPPFKQTQTHGPARQNRAPF
jgi:hypothetical protein